MTLFSQKHIDIDEYCLKYWTLYDNCDHLHFGVDKSSIGSSDTQKIANVQHITNMVIGKRSWIRYKGESTLWHILTNITTTIA